jgi:Spy/CpxP family protein refolding chaperone
VKTNWRKFSVIAAAATFLLTATVVVFSQRPEGPPQGPPPGGPMGPGFGFRGPGPGGPGGPRDGLGPLADLNLTDAQKDQIKKIHESFGETAKQFHEQMRALNENRTDPMAGNFDEAAFRAAAEARARIQIELEVLHAKMMSQVASVLTAEQKAQLAERHSQMRRMGPPQRPGEIN